MPSNAELIKISICELVNMAENFVRYLYAFLNGNPIGVTWAHDGNGFHLDISEVPLDVFQGPFQRSIAGFESEVTRWGFVVEGNHYRHRDDLFLRDQPELVDGIVRDPSPAASPPAGASPQADAAAVMPPLHGAPPVAVVPPLHGAPPVAAAAAVPLAILPVWGRKSQRGPRIPRAGAWGWAPFESTTAIAPGWGVRMGRTPRYEVP
ncbi:hypothetical protein ACFX1R_027700 [Malus domestica]